MDVLLPAGTVITGSYTGSTTVSGQWLLNMYGVTGGGTSWVASSFGISDGLDGPGFSYGLGYTIGTTAIGSPHSGGTILASDIAAGVIPHGLTMAFDYTYLGGGTGTYGSTHGGTPGDQIPPAVSNDDGGSTGPLPEGGLLLIPVSTSMPGGLSAMGQQLWIAAQTYGCYITDQAGGDAFFYGDGSSLVGGAFTSGDLNAVGQALELVVTW
jgi:hypothetical protein